MRITTPTTPTTPTILTAAILALAASPAFAQVERISRPTTALDAQIFGTAETRQGFASIGRALARNNQEVTVLSMHTPSGAVLWQHFFVDARNSHGFCIVTTRDGGLAFAGETDSINPNQAYTTLVKTDSAGNLLWARAIPATTYADTPIAVGLRETREGQLALVSRTRTAGAPGQFGTAALFTPAGGVVWANAYRDPRVNLPRTHFADLREVTDAAGNRALMVVGATAPDPAAPSNAIATILREADGQSLIARQYNFLGGGEDAHANGLLQINAQQFRLTGRYTFAQVSANDDALAWDIDAALNPAPIAALYRGFKVAHNAIEPSFTAAGLTNLAGWFTPASGAPDHAMLMSLGVTPNIQLWCNTYDGPNNGAPDRFHALLTSPSSNTGAGFTAGIAGTTWYYNAVTNPVGRDSCEAFIPVPALPIQPRSAAFEFPRTTLPVVPYPVTNPPEEVFQRIVCNFCPADFNEDGFLDFFDYDDYVNCYENGVCPPGKDADFNGDGFADFFDYDAFVAAYERGC